MQGSQKVQRQLPRRGKLPNCATGRPGRLLLDGSRFPRQQKASANATTRDCLTMPRQPCPALNNASNMRQWSASLKLTCTESHQATCNLHALHAAKAVLHTALAPLLLHCEHTSLHGCWRGRYALAQYLLRFILSTKLAF